MAKETAKTDDQDYALANKDDQDELKRLLAVVENDEQPMIVRLDAQTRALKLALAYLGFDLGD
jgi:hypothetical protein